MYYLHLNSITKNLSNINFIARVLNTGVLGAFFKSQIEIGDSFV